MSLKALQAEHLARRTPITNTRAAAPRTALSSKSQDALGALKSLGSSFQLRGKSSAVLRTNVEVGKLKAAAKGDVRTPVERRVYVHLKYLDKVLPFFIDAQWSVGRTLDAVASKAGLVNENARTTDEGRRLHLLCQGIVLEPSQVVGKLVKSGDSILIFRGVRPVDV
ncbi:Putative uncharacterized protein [Taphrina deformans PYCC 5710]|uniref:ZFAND1-like ubiquitin-like domain-containing protein n=1 Tax=Taphrina deformans (strain PYCC 5710 / ATCC 11124 / CBS 356.35 / IMI 108563 / JCM 9778 / NBRC 8474) TaxID=1097556 RepID=R4X9G1_TAPDE|nr:Putative uncharacterized protein [Taphrina deformans PYCC 5710]|eukprot:CCG80854.1 Putative uncharacterized protein [Taphrina deformans PYCC 5710]